jgi:hypothetical protein
VSAIQETVQEELENTLKTLQRCKEELDALPKGCLRKRMVQGQEYFYRVFREGAKVKYVYLGKLSEEQINVHNESRLKRKTYKEAIKELNQRIDYLKRILKVKERVSHTSSSIAGG